MSQLCSSHYGFKCAGLPLCGSNGIRGRHHARPVRERCPYRQDPAPAFPGIPAAAVQLPDATTLGEKLVGWEGNRLAFLRLQGRFLGITPQRRVYLLHSMAGAAEPGHAIPLSHEDDQHDSGGQLHEGCHHSGGGCAAGGEAEGQKYPQCSARRRRRLFRYGGRCHPCQSVEQGRSR